MSKLDEHMKFSAEGLPPCLSQKSNWPVQRGRNEQGSKCLCRPTSGPLLDIVCVVPSTRRGHLSVSFDGSVFLHKELPFDQNAFAPVYSPPPSLSTMEVDILLPGDGHARHATEQPVKTAEFILLLDPHNIVVSKDPNRLPRAPEDERDQELLHSILAAGGDQVPSQVRQISADPARGSAASRCTDEHQLALFE